ncbi:MAG: PilX N-terminal domain-containing pilus assembly protein [Desulfobacteraceae bacterium]|jgi:Tfp pilus assembly protein PilX|nr:PilX N-terminal domain-containing pilus assembly protein [Desulfobacteraceae bacterium]
MKTTAILKNENGAIMMLVTVMFLVLLTVISIAASRTATVETKIAANEYAYQRCFYNSEGAIMEAVDLLDTEVNPKDEVPAWMGGDSSEINNDTVFNYWVEEAGTGAVTPQSATVDETDSGFMAVHLGVLPGNSLDMSRPTKHSFDIYSRCAKDGTVMLTVGYANAYK